MANRFGLNAAPQTYLQGFDAHADVKGKGKFKETDFDAAFAQAASSITTAPAKIETQSSGDTVDQLEKDLNNARLDDVPATTHEELLGNVEFKRSVHSSVLALVVKLMINLRFCSVWEQMQNSDMPPKPEEMAKWEAEFNQLMNAQREDGEWEYSTSMQRAWEEGVATELDDSFTHNMKFDHEGLPILGPYVFGLLSSVLCVRTSAHQVQSKTTNTSIHHLPRSHLWPWLNRCSSKTHHFRKSRYFSRPPFRKASSARAVTRRGFSSAKPGTWTSARRQA